MDARTVANEVKDYMVSIAENDMLPLDMTDLNIYELERVIHLTLNGFPWVLDDENSVEPDLESRRNDIVFSCVGSDSIEHGRFLALKHAQRFALMNPNLHIVRIDVVSIEEDTEQVISQISVRGHII